jgi:hypothetical protein
MKASILGLVLSTAAFGGTTVYFWQQFSAARAQAEQVAEANRVLNERVAALEKAREELMNRRFAGPNAGNPFMAGVIDQNSRQVANPAAAAMPAEQSTLEDGRAPEKASQPFTVLQRPQMPASMIKTMRNQVRAQNEKTYFDLQQRLGLREEDAAKLLDLITEQHTSSFAQVRNSSDPAAGDASRNDWQRFEEQISELLGPAKAAQYAEYKKEMPARMEVAALAQQFESSDAPLSEQQRTRLITAMSEERDSVPMPSWSGGASQEQYGKDFTAWQADYEQRAAERARTILNAEQLAVYDEYQQFQKDLRAQMGSARYVPSGGVATMIGPNVRMRAVPPPPQDRAN